MGRASLSQNLADASAPERVRELATKLRELAARYPESVTLALGDGKAHRQHGAEAERNGLIEVYGSGELRFRPLKFVRALGEEGGRAYAEALERVVPNIFNQRYPGLMPAKAAEVAPTLFEVIREAVEKSPSSISTHR